MAFSSQRARPASQDDGSRVRQEVEAHEGVPEAHDPVQNSGSGVKAAFRRSSPPVPGSSPAPSPVSKIDQGSSVASSRALSPAPAQSAYVPRKAQPSQNAPVRPAPVTNNQASSAPSQGGGASGQWDRNKGHQGGSGFRSGSSARSGGSGGRGGFRSGKASSGGDFDAPSGSVKDRRPRLLEELGIILGLSGEEMDNLRAHLVHDPAKVDQFISRHQPAIDALRRQVSGSIEASRQSNPGSVYFSIARGGAVKIYEVKQDAVGNSGVDLLDGLVVHCCSADQTPFPKPSELSLDVAVQGVSDPNRGVRP